LKLSLDEIQFVAEGGEITWNTETGEDWPAEGKEEEAEHNNNDKEELNLEEPKAKIPTKSEYIFVADLKLCDFLPPFVKCLMENPESSR
jgi:hypothetical protein